MCPFEHYLCKTGITLIRKVLKGKPVGWITRTRPITYDNEMREEREWGHRTFNTVHSQNGQRIYISYVGQWNLLSVGPQTTYEWKSIINSPYCSDRRKPNYGQKRNIRTQVTSPTKSSMNFKGLRLAFCIVLLHRKITNENVLDKLL
jgi:hypothetical protein